MNPPFPAVVVATEAMVEMARDAALLAGQQIGAWIDWSDLPAGLDRQPSASVVVVETQGVDDRDLATMLPHIATFATAANRQLVVTLLPEAIDVVTAAMLGGNVQLLCSPTMAERVAALAVAAEITQSPGDLAATWRESEAERLERLNQEVARIAEVLARLARQEGAAAPSQEGRAEDRRGSFGHEPAAAGVAIDAADVRRMIRARRLRDTFFSSGLFEDPAWDMLLDLFAAELEGTQVSVSSLCIAAAVAPTTALRWIGKMSDAGLFERRPDPADRRRAFMALTGRATEAMRGYLVTVQRAGLPLA